MQKFISKLFFVSLFVGLFAGVALCVEKEQATDVDFHTIIFKSHESYGADEYQVLQEENPEQFALCLKHFKTIKTFDDIAEDGVFTFPLRKKQGKASVIMKSIVEILAACDEEGSNSFKEFLSKTTDDNEFLLKVIWAIDFWHIEFFRNVLIVFLIENTARLKEIFEKIPFSLCKEIMIFFINNLAESVSQYEESFELILFTSEKFKNFFKEHFIHHCIKKLDSSQRGTLMVNLLRLLKEKVTIEEKREIGIIFFKRMLGNAQFKEGFSAYFRGVALMAATIFGLSEVVSDLFEEEGTFRDLNPIVKGYSLHLAALHGMNVFLKMIKNEDFMNGILAQYKEEAFLNACGTENISFVKEMNKDENFMHGISVEVKEEGLLHVGLS